MLMTGACRQKLSGAVDLSQTKLHKCGSKQAILLGNKMSCSERQKEIKRRRKRREKLKVFRGKAAKASVSEKGEIARKLREMTPGAEALITELALEER